MTDEHEHAMKVWWEACAAYEDGAATDTSQPVRGMAIVGDQAAAAAVIAADRAGMVAEVERLRAAISWIMPPFVDELTSVDELRRRIGFVVADATRAALKDTRHDEQ